jgi:hypothetical protein
MTIAQAKHNLSSKRGIDFKILVLFLPVIFLVAQFLRSLLPNKYFYDSVSILNMVNGDVVAYQLRDSSYQATADFFSFINVLHLSTIQEWSFVLGILGSLLLLPLVLSFRNLSILDTLLYLSFISLLNIYVFTISKEMIQFLSFCIIAYIWKNLSEHKFLLIFITTFILILEALLFRYYFLLIAVFFIVFAVLFSRMDDSHSSKNKIVLKVLVYTVTTVLVFLFLAKLAAPSSYESLASIRDQTAVTRIGSVDARTVITNPLPGEGVISTWLNFILNGVRMMLPLELLLKGVQYVPFVLFQILLGRIYYLNIKDIGTRLANRRLLALCFFSAFITVSFFFEPDFGSWVRHESSTFPLFCVFPALKTSD